VKKSSTINRNLSIYIQGGGKVASKTTMGTGRASNIGHKGAESEGG